MCYTGTVVMEREQQIAQKKVKGFPEMPDGSKLSGSSVYKQVMSWYVPDGRVEMANGELWYPQRENISHLSSEEKEDLQLQFAKVLYRHAKSVHRAITDPVERKIIEQNETLLAFDFAEYLHEPQFLEGIVGIVNAVIAQDQEETDPSRNDYPSIY